VAAAIADQADSVSLAPIPPALFEHPAFAPYREYLPTLGIERTRALDDPAEPIPRLIAPLPRAVSAMDYERRIVEQNELIVRPGNLHDTINALVWSAFPRTKRAISETHVALGAAPTANGRPRRRDILTLFDEAGALIISQRDDLQALHEGHAWRRLFVDHRADFIRDCRVVLFGHGTLEQLASNPHRGLTVKALWLPLPVDASIDRLDSYLADGITAASLLTADERRLPLPILGVPGWFEENELPICYDDVDVFRPRRAPDAANRAGSSELAALASSARRRLPSVA